MSLAVRRRIAGVLWRGATCAALAVAIGCQHSRGVNTARGAPDDAIRTYVARHRAAAHDVTALAYRSTPHPTTNADSLHSRDRFGGAAPPPQREAFTFALFDEPDAQASQPSTPHDQAQHADQRGRGAPPGYWRRNVWHQMGREALNFGSRGVWDGFKTAFWDVENALLLTSTLGASIALQETGVDHTIRHKTRDNRQLGNFDEPIQLIGHPATHFAGTGVLWLTSALTHDLEEHEVARSLTKALAVNGISTMLLKVSAGTTAPNGDNLAWPSGHTSSSFCTAAVLNEYYGPWVGVPSLALAGLVGYQRIDSRVHDFSDVVFGGMLGYVIGTSIARDGKASMPEVFGMTVLPYQDPQTGAAGLALYKRW